MMLDLLKAAFLGIVEGLTEFIPVSSTGHLLLLGHFFGFDDEEFGKAFTVLIQLGMNEGTDGSINDRDTTHMPHPGVVPYALDGYRYNLDMILHQANASIMEGAAFAGGLDDCAVECRGRGRRG